VTRHRVRLSEDAEHDLVDISYIAIRDSVEHADYVLDELEALCSSLTELPLRGHGPPELERIGVGSYLEVHFLLRFTRRSVIGEGSRDGRVRTANSCRSSERVNS
jgi:toxin ParE1/3/4